MDGRDQAGFGVVGGHVGDVIDVRPNEVVQVGGGGGSERRVQSRSFPSAGKYGFLWTCGSAPSLLLHPGSATGHLIAPGDHHTLQHI